MEMFGCLQAERTMRYANAFSNKLWLLVTAYIGLTHCEGYSSSCTIGLSISLVRRLKPSIRLAQILVRARKGDIVNSDI